jgi:hypothetical protein
VLNLPTHGDEQKNDEVAVGRVSRGVGARCAAVLLKRKKKQLKYSVNVVLEGIPTYRTRMGQNTGISNTWNNVMQKAMTVPLTREYLQHTAALHVSPTSPHKHLRASA